MNANRPLLYMYTFFSFYFLGIISSYGQGWPDFSEKTTFIEAQRHFTDYWSDRTPTRGSGWKQYKRWEWYWSTRTMPDGSFPPANYNMIQYDSFVAKNAPDIIKSTNLNSNWNSLGPSSSNSGYSGIGRVNCIAFHPSSSSTIWAGTPAGGIWRTTNGGSNWTPLSDNLSVLGVTAIAVNPSNPNILYIGTGDGFGYDTQSIGVLKSTDGGVSWAPTGLTFDVGSNNQVFQLIVNPSNPTILMAATTNGLYRTTNSGSSWTQVYTSMTRDVRFKPNAANTVYACTNDKLLRSTNGGQSFSVVATIPNSIRIALAVSPANSGLVVAVSCNNEGAFNGLYRSTNSGATYALTSSTPNILNASSNGSGTDGQGWYDLCVSISPTNANMVFVGGVNLWRSTNGGSSWALINFWNSSGGAPSGVATVHADKHFLGWQNNNTIFQGCDGGIYKSTNNGTSWTDISNTMVISQIYRISSSQADSKILCGLQDNGTKLRNGSNNWIDVLGGDGMDCAIHPANHNVMYGTIQRGVLHRSVDGGNNWVNIHQNIPNQPEGAWITPISLAPNGTLLAGYNDIWRTTNQGNSWTRISTNLSSSQLLKCLVVAPTNINSIYASNGTTIFRTTNGGASWNSLSFIAPAGAEISALYISSFNANEVYLTLSGYVSGQKIYRSTNGGTSWTNISSNLPNLPANCIVEQHNSNGAIYIGMDVGVYYRAPNTNTWVLYNTGLPNVPIFDLDIRVSENLLRAATFGRGLWESSITTTSSPCETPTAGLSTTNITSSSARLNWPVITGALNYTIQLRVINGTWSDLNGGPFASSFADVTGLLANTTYEWRIRANCGFGNSNYSSSISFTTTTQASCPVPTGLNTTNIASTSARFNWTAVSGASNYTIQLRSANGTWSDLNGGPFTSNFVNVTGLVANTGYEWRVRANCGSSSSGYASGVSFTTAQSSCSTPTGLNTTNIASTSARFNWTLVTGAQSYTIQLRIGTGAWSDLNGGPFTGSFVNVTGLVAGTVYEWRVRANCGGVSSAYSSGISFTTSVSGCGIPGGLYTSNVSQARATLHWGGVSGATSYIVQFLIGGSWSSLSPVSSNILNIYGLYANASYQWRVIAVCNTSQGTPSSSHVFTTEYAPDCNIGIQYPAFSLSPSPTWQYQTQMWGGEYCLVNVQAGQVYTFSYCSSDGAVLNFDGELSIRTINNQLIAYSDDVCGSQPRLVWQAGFTGQVRVLLTLYSCLTQNTNSTLAFRLGGTPLDDNDEDRIVSSEIEERCLDIPSNQEEYILPGISDFDIAKGSSVSTKQVFDAKPSFFTVSISPNPAVHIARVIVNTLEVDPETQSASITLLDINGTIHQVVSNLPVHSNSVLQKEIDLTGLPSGVYIVQVQIGSQISRTQLLSMSRR